MESYFNSLKRRIVLEGLEVLYRGGDLKVWARDYAHREEVILPEELDLCQGLLRHIDSGNIPQEFPNPRNNPKIVEDICSVLG